MSPFYRKPKPETMRANRENYKRVYKHEIKWLKENVGKLTRYKHKFLLDMYSILITGSRKVTPKMASTIQSSMYKCQQDPRYNEDKREEVETKLKPILSKYFLYLGKFS